MASNALYISVMTPPVSAGTIDIHIKTSVFSPSNNNPPTDVLTGTTGIPEGLNIPASADFTYTQAVTGSEDEEDLAEEICNGLGAYLIANQLNYQGWLAYTEEVYPATFQVTRTDHCICIWSQTLFDIEIPTNTSNAKLVVNKSSALLTLQEAKDLAPNVNYDWRTEARIAMTDDQIISSIVSSSSFLTNRT